MNKKCTPNKTSINTLSGEVIIMNAKMKYFIAACVCGTIAASSGIVNAPAAYAENVTVNNPIIWSDVPDDDVILSPLT